MRTIRVTVVEEFDDDDLTSNLILLEMPQKVKDDINEMLSKIQDAVTYVSAEEF